MSDATERRIAGFVDKYTPAIAAQLRDARQRLRAHFPRGVEMVFDNYNALVFGIGPTDQSRDSFISIAGYPKWVTLFFLDGARLDDPEGLLEGEGKQVRGIRLKTPADMDSPAIAALIAQAVAPTRRARGRAAAGHRHQGGGREAAAAPARRRQGEVDHAVPRPGLPRRDRRADPRLPRPRRRASKASGMSLTRIDAALAAFEPAFFNNLLIALDARFAERPAAAGPLGRGAALARLAACTTAACSPADPAIPHDADDQRAAPGRRRARRAQRRRLRGAVRGLPRADDRGR